MSELLFLQLILSVLGICSFAPLLFCSSLFAFLLKIAIFKAQPWAIHSCALKKRATVSKLFLLLYSKEWLEPIALVALQNRATRAIHSWFALSFKKTSSSLKKMYCFTLFLTDLSLLSPILCLRANHSRCSFLKSDGSKSLQAIFYKEWLWANHSRHYSQKSDHKQIAILLFRLKKWVNRS